MIFQSNIIGIKKIVGHLKVSIIADIIISYVTRNFLTIAL